MRPAEVSDSPNNEETTLSDTELLTVFHNHAERAWEIFIERYADVILSHLRSLGFDYDQAMDRFVYVCEKLCEQNF